MNGYIEAAKIDEMIMETYNSKHGFPRPNDLRLYNIEMLKYLRTIETTCQILQAEIVKGMHTFD